MVEILILAIACLLNGLIGLAVYLKNPRSHTNRLFFMLTCSFAAWSLVNYVSVHPVLFSQLTWIRLVLFNASILCLLVFLTFLAFPESTIRHHDRRRVTLAVGFSVIAMLLTLTPFVFKGLNTVSGNPSPEPAPGIVIFLAQSVGLLGLGIATVIRKYRASFGKARDQLRLIIMGLAGTFALIVVTNLFLVVFGHNTAFVPYGPAFTLIFSASFAYAIIRHRLFDIRAAIARSLAYLLIVATMSGVYGIALLGAVNVLFPGPHWEFLRQAIAVVMITPLALTFQSTKRFFDRLTHRLFYRDDYDFQEVLDEMGNIVVAEFELYKILNGSRRVLSKALKSAFIEFVLFKNDKPYFEAHTYKTIGQSTLALGSEIITQQKDLLEVEAMSYPHRLHEKLKDADVALSLRLKTHEQVVGYIIFGAKRSGNIYSAQDKRLLLILANELAIAIQNAMRFEEIQNFNFTLQARVEEATHKLRHANERLKSLDETKDDFISMASHQLRTPLTSIKGYLSMVLEGDAGKLTPMQKEMLGQAFFSSQRMVYIIADLLNVSRLKTGKFIIEPSKINLAEVIAEELVQVEEMAASKQLTLQYDKPKDFPDLMLDETKIRQVIMNFVDNAIYYTPSGGHITVRLLNKPSTLELRVEDNGIGVPKHEQPHLFTKFYRAGNARKARPDGTGLGLFMAKKVIVAQGGSILFASHEGKGSMFGFVFSKSHLKAGQPEKPAVAAISK